MLRRRWLLSAIVIRALQKQPVPRVEFQGDPGLNPGLLASKLIGHWRQAVVPLLLVALKLVELAPCPCTGLNWEPLAIYRVGLCILPVIVAWRGGRSGGRGDRVEFGVIALLFVLVPGLLAFKLIGHWRQAVVPLLIVALKLMELAPCPCTYLDWEPRTIYRMWFCILLAIVVWRRRPLGRVKGNGLNRA